MVTIYVEGRKYETEAGQNLLHACLSLGFDLPYFCWHPDLGSVGACRQCAVKQFKDENDRKGRIVMACMTPVEDGMRISIDDPEARAFRSSVIEWLMMNHPHDCPVCDEGGECHLQDMTVLTGHAYREYRFGKRTYRNQNLGPLIEHEMNRCIQCYRCVRFYRGRAGGRDFHVFGSAGRVYFGRHADGPLESEFSGNLVEVCPTGVFTDKTPKRRSNRKWDLQTAPSVCVHCGVGCNTFPGERYGGLRRVRNRYHHEVNGYYLCDRGRYGYEFVNGEERPRRPLLRGETGVQRPVSREEAIARAAALLKDRSRVIGIGSPRASLEANFALRTLVGESRFFLGLSEADFRALTTTVKILREGPVATASLREVSEADAALVLGEDVSNTAPMMALALHRMMPPRAVRRAADLRIPLWNDAGRRQIEQEEKKAIYVATPASTRLDPVAARVLRAAPDDVTRLGFAVAAAISGEAPGGQDGNGAVGEEAAEIARALLGAERPLVVSGFGCGSPSVLEAAANVAWALVEKGRDARLSVCVPECNTLGVGLLGGGSIEEAFRRVEEGKADTLIVLENDLYRRAVASSVDLLFEKAAHLIVVDHGTHPTSRRAEIVLPSATFAEAAGTLVNQEGRAQRFYAVFPQRGDIQAGWRWMRDLRGEAGSPEAADWQTLDQILGALAGEIPLLAGVDRIAPPADFRSGGRKVPRQSHRFSGRTALTADVSVHEPKPPEDPDSALGFTMEGSEGEVPPALIPRFWAPGWNSVQATNKFQREVAGPLRGGDPGRRLLTPAPVGQVRYCPARPPAFPVRPDEWLVVPIHHIFGSEELSVRSPGIAERACRPYVALHPEDAAELRIAEGEEARVEVGGGVQRLPVRLSAGLPKRVAGLPAGLPGLPFTELPAAGTISRGSET